MWHDERGATTTPSPGLALRCRCRVQLFVLRVYLRARLSQLSLQACNGLLVARCSLGCALAKAAVTLVLRSLIICMHANDGTKNSPRVLHQEAVEVSRVQEAVEGEVQGGPDRSQHRPAAGGRRRGRQTGAARPAQAPEGTQARRENNITKHSYKIINNYND